MRKTIALTMVLLLMGLMGAAYADTPVITDINPEQPLFDSDSARGYSPQPLPSIVYVGIGGTLELVLEENPTTGFTWHVMTELPDSIHLKVDEYVLGYDPAGVTEVRQANGEETVTEAPLGAAGVHRYMMVFEEQGMFDLEFSYHRDWEPDIVAESYQLTVNVVPDGDMIVILNQMTPVGTGEVEPMLLTTEELVPVEGLALGAPDTEPVAMEVEEPGFFRRLIEWFLNLFR